jgi:hypothetical protein
MDEWDTVDLKARQGVLLEKEKVVWILKGCGRSVLCARGGTTPV